MERGRNLKKTQKSLCLVTFTRNDGIDQARWYDLIKILKYYSLVYNSTSIPIAMNEYDKFIILC